MAKTKEEKKETPQVEKPETLYKKGMINSTDQAAPQLKSYDNGILRMTGNLVMQNREGEVTTMNFVAYNKDAEKIHTSLTQGEKHFTLAGEQKNGSLYVRNVYQHRMMSIEGKINHMEQKEGNTRLLVGVHSDKIGNQTFAVNIKDGKELNGAKLEKGSNIAINGEGKIYDYVKEPNKRGVDITAWNVAPTKAELDKIVATKQEQSKSSEVEQTV